MISHWDFNIFMILCHIGDRGRLLSTLSARPVGLRCPFFRRGCRGLLCRAAAVGPVALGSNRSSAAHTEGGIVVEDPFGHQHYVTVLILFLY